VVFKYQVADMVFVFVVAMATVAGCSNARNSNDNRPQSSPTETVEPTQGTTAGKGPQINSAHAIDLPRPIAPSGQSMGAPTPGVTPPVGGPM